MDGGDHYQARLIALELLFRGMLTGLVSQALSPIGEVDRMEEEFRSTVRFLRMGAGDDHAEAIRQLVKVYVDKNFEAIRERVIHNAQIEAAQAGTRN